MSLGLSPSAAAVAVAEHEDLLKEILLLLPGKSLARLKVVCKRWRFLISQPFITGIFPPTADGPLSTTEIIDSCHGLFLCSNSRLFLDRNDENNNLFIYESKSRRFVTIKPPPGHILSVKLAYDPSKSPHWKLVLVRTEDSPWVKFETYSGESGTDTWTSARGPPYFVHTNFAHFRDGVFSNGIVKWPVTGCPKLSLRFDVEKQSIRCHFGKYCFKFNE